MEYDDGFPIEMTPETMTQVARLTRDLRAAGALLSRDEARFFVGAYYMMQNDRIRAAHQTRTLSESGEPAALMDWLAEQRATLEKQVQRALDAYSYSSAPGKWARSIPGIGPVITAGLLAHLDVTKAQGCGAFWKFAGLDPSSKWEKGQKRPHNAALKRLCFLIGESFVKVSGNPRDIYGQVYKRRKEMETAMNEAGRYADQAAASLATKKYGADTEARKHYEAGRLPPARIHMRAKRYAVKLFLSHLFDVMWWNEYGTAPPKPYILTEAGRHHTQFLAPPNWPLTE